MELIEEKTTSEYMSEIMAHYLVNNCKHCPFYFITETCDSVPLNCTWAVLWKYFEGVEQEENEVLE